jgi:AcrR family transcriptional regulator
MSPRRYDLGARAEAVNATRRRILDAAVAVFDDEGFAGSSVDRIAARADVTRATVYHHFDSKLGLLEALAADAADQAGLADIVALGESASTVGEVHALLEGFVTFWAAHAVLFRNITGLSGVDPDAAAVVEQRDDNRRRGLTALVERIADRGLLDVGTTREHAAEGLWLLTSYPVFDHLHRRSGLTIDETTAMVTTFADALFAREPSSSAAPPLHQSTVDTEVDHHEA